MTFEITTSEEWGFVLTRVENGMIYGRSRDREMLEKFGRECQERWRWMTS